MNISTETFKKIKLRATQLDNDFEGFRSKGRDIQQYLCPWRGRFLAGDNEKEARGELYNDESIHNTLIFQAIDTASAGIKSGLSPSSRPWFRIGAEDSRLSELGEPARWLAHVQRVLYSIMSRNNTYNSLQEIYAELVTFATCSAAVLPDNKTVSRMKTFSFGEYRLATDYRDEFNTFARRFYKTTGQLVGEFGKENVSDEVSQAFKDGHLNRMVLCQGLIDPNEEGSDLKDALGRDWRSIYWEVGTKSDAVLGVRGFEQFPIIGSVWDAVGSSVYGIGPGHKNLRNGKRLQKLEEDSLQNLALTIAPPMVTDSANKDVIVDASPWGLTRSNENPASSRAGIRMLYEQKALTRDLEYKIERNEQALRDGFYNNIFLMMRNQAESIKTAYQAARMMEEKYSVLGPVLERSQQMLSQLIQLNFAYALDYGLIPEAPVELQGSELKIEYISILAQAQKIAGLQSIHDTMAFVSTASQIWPEARFKFDPLQAIDEVAQANGAPPSIIRSDDEVAVMMEQDAKARQAAAQGQAMLTASEGARNMKDVKIGGRSAIEVLMGDKANG